MSDLNSLSLYKKESLWIKAWKRMKKNKPAIVGLVIILIFVFFALFANVIADYNEVALKQDYTQKLLPPNSNNILGTDALGRDIFARIIHGARLSLTLGFVIVGIALFFGVSLGGISAFYGGMIDLVIMRLLDVFMAIPPMLLMLSLVAALGPGLDKLMIALIVVIVPGYTRISRASMLAVSGNEYIEAAKACGCSNLKIIFKHLFPNALGPILVVATLSLASTIVMISGFSFLGIGISAPTPEWGAMLSEARANMRYNPYLMIIPGTALLLVSVSFNLIGDGIRDALDPRVKG
ncbi:MAG: ABC transporter permease [Eubacteriales bacterium]|nr:ABC transporter permease [Eubacteriales bacterium]